MWRHVLYLVALWRVCACAAYLLPTDVKPRHYDVSLIFDVDPKTNFSFYGVVDILLTVKKPTSKIVLHAQGYQIEKKSITLDGDLPPKIVDTKLNNTYNMFTVKLDSTLQAGKNYTLTIPFYGNLMASLDGAYISSYMDKSSNTKEYLVVTQFEAISARKSFPCFDEPMYKATFSLTIGHHRDYSCISNMPLYNSSEVNTAEDIWPWTEIATTFKKEQQEFIWDQFETSVPMSTYLIAFVVSKFAHVDSPGHLSSTRFRIWARKDAIDQTEYAANLGPRTLSFFEEYFNVSFPLPKQDMIAIPDFSAGAMENWGLITYRETALLYDKKQSSFLNKERVAEVIAHELAHQWFGNLVTMKWWSDLWLNEGFATFVASVGVARVEPAWRADLNYAVESIMAVMSLDALESSHPVSVPLDDPKRISEIFDEISYRKGAALIRMMTMFLGEDVFRKAIHDYLVKYSYSNAQQDDLWAELTRVSLQYGGLTRNVTVKQVMDTWTTQTGYPIIEARRDYAESTVTVTQKRFLPVGSKASTAVSWWIPLNVICQSEVGQPSDPVEWLASDEGVQNKHRFEHAANPAEWILFNPDMIAPYRINYDQRNWELLTNTLTSDKFTDIPVLGRVQLLSDAFSLAWNNQLDYSVTLSIANYLQRETEHLPLSIGLRMLSVLDGVLKRSADYGAFQKFVRKLITAQYQQAGGLALKRVVNGDDLTSVKMQTLTSSWACHTKVPQCEENAMELYREWMEMANPDENNPIPLDLRRTVYCVGIARGSVAEWRFALARLQRTNVAAAKDLLQKALACTREVWILKQYLEWSVTDGSIVRSQDAGRVISEITSSTVGFYVARDFIYTRIDDIVGAFKGQGRKLGVLLNTFLRQFTTQAELDEFLIWKDKNAKYMEDIKLKLSQGIEAAKLNIDWLKRNQKLVIDKLREFSTTYQEPVHEESTLVSTRHVQPDSMMSSILAIHNLTIYPTRNKHMLDFYKLLK